MADSFCLPPCSIILPKFRSRNNTLVTTTPFWISRTTHLSTSGIYVDSFTKKGACVEIIRAWGGCQRSCCRPSPMMTTKAFRGDAGDRRIHVFEQEGLVGGDEKVRLPDGGLEDALNHHSKWLVAASVSLVGIWRHDAKALWLLIMSVLNMILSTVLKQVLNQDRPVSSPKTDPGMPSSHAQCLFFASTLVVVSMMEWLGVNTLSLVLSALVLAVGSYLSWLRVSQQFHTVSQVLVGATLGSAFSIFSFWSWNAVIKEAYISHLWVRVCLAVGAAGFPLALGYYVVRHWVKDDS